VRSWDELQARTGHRRGAGGPAPGPHDFIGDLLVHDGRLAAGDRRWKALITRVGALDENQPEAAAVSRRVIDRVLADHAQGAP
jgi:hypothetical protein